MLRQFSEKLDDPMAETALIVFWMRNIGASEKGSEIEPQMDVSFLLKLTVSLAACASLLPVPRLQLSSAPCAVAAACPLRDLVVRLLHAGKFLGCLCRGWILCDAEALSPLHRTLCLMVSGST